MDESTVRKIAAEVMESNYRFGSPRIPPHTHDGVDNLKIPVSSILGLTTGGFSNIQVFTASGTFSVPSSTTYWVRAVGAGAGSAWDGQSSGGGAYCESLLDLTAGTSISVGIGLGGTAGNGGTLSSPTAGGDTTFGSYFTAGGGQVSAGGTATGADINISGGNPDASFRNQVGATFGYVSGRGGSSMFGQGGSSVFSAANSNPYASGRAGTGYGAGASAGTIPSGAGTNGNGAAGTPGILIIMW